jgi:phosphoribosylanthranilate isomerase
MGSGARTVSQMATDDASGARTWVKVCGVRRPQDLVAAIESGVDAVGLVFAERSKRRIDPDEARLLVRIAADAAICVGVFEGQRAWEVAEVLDETGLRAVQYYGPIEEFVSLRETFPDLDLAIYGVRVRRSAEGGAVAVYETLLGSLSEVGDVRLPDAFLFDSPTPGSGERWDVESLGGYFGPIPYVVAGGLGPENVAEVVMRLRPWGVDASSSLEVSPGVKDPSAISRFVDAVRTADRVAFPSRLGEFHLSPNG